ncbi:MAG: hypothetical protein A4E67_00991 [Syntrophaceae bacterium PtaB.Bin038]|nr:MAG: hypothetical protein A4E67_00991 [Syntrophaceae bacterium PtaB.Bin038]
MTHGDHWAAIDPDHERLIEEMLSVVGTKGRVVGRSNTVVGDGERQWESEVVGLRYPADPLGFLGLVVARDGRREMWTAFPHAEGRSRSTLIVERIEPEGNGIEAVIHVGMPDAGGFSVSDPLYFLDKDHLEEGREAAFRLSAVAYGLRKCEPVSLTGGPLFEMLREEYLEENPDRDPAEVTAIPISVAGTACLFPEEDADAQVMFRVDEVYTFDCGRPVTRLSGVVMRSGEDRELRIDVYASAPALDGYVPRVGDEVQAVVWMQGVLDR